ncbi:MAG: FRG domain-containing protein, partial [Gammaproteobacteria bacterium]
LDGVAVLQHYGWPTPLIDLTGTLEVAVFFALHGSSVRSRAITYVVDTQKLPEQGVVVDHTFLTHTLHDGGLRCRWLRQDGFALTTRDWRAATDAREFDLLTAPFGSALEAHEFSVTDGERPELADVLSTAGDPIPQHLQNLLRLFCEHQFEGALAPKLAEIVKGMCNATAT